MLNGYNGSYLTHHSIVVFKSVVNKKDGVVKSFMPYLNT